MASGHGEKRGLLFGLVEFTQGPFPRKGKKGSTGQVGLGLHRLGSNQQPRYVNGAVMAQAPAPHGHDAGEASA